MWWALGAPPTCWACRTKVPCIHLPCCLFCSSLNKCDASEHCSMHFMTLVPALYSYTVLWFFALWQCQPKAVHSTCDSGCHAILSQELGPLMYLCSPLCRFQCDHFHTLRQQQNSERVSIRGAGLKLAAGATPVVLLPHTPQSHSARSRGQHTTFHSGPATRACCSSFACEIA